MKKPVRVAYGNFGALISRARNGSSTAQTRSRAGTGGCHRGGTGVIDGRSLPKADTLSPRCVLRQVEVSCPAE